MIWSFSDSSIASANSSSRPIIFEDQTHAHIKDQGAQVSSASQEGLSDPTSNLQIPQVQEPSYTIPPQPDQLLPPPPPPQQQQQRYVQMSTHYIPHHATNPLLIPSYYQPIYATQSQHQLHHHPVNQQHHPLYVMPMPQTQPYNMPVQPNISDNNSAIASSHPLPSPSPTIVHPSGYKDTNTMPPLIPLKHEMASSSLYGSYISPAPPPLIPVQSNQYQQQHPGISSQPQPVSVASNYTFDYPHAAQDQAYYAQHPLPPQYQTMTTAAAVALSDASKQLPDDISKQQTTTPQQLV